MAADRGSGPAASETAGAAEVVVCELGSMRFALASSQVDGLTQAFAFDALPSAPDVVAGAANLRGESVPVFDLRARFRLPAKPLDVSDHFVVARAGGRRVILRVDRALELRTVLLAAFQASAGSDDLVAGAATIEDGILFIYDLAGLLDEAQRLALDRALSEHRSRVSS
jgi:purine-binding chemotaxis protein CheW